MISTRSNPRNYSRIRPWSSFANWSNSGAWTSPNTRWESTRIKSTSTQPSCSPSEVTPSISNPTAVISISSVLPPILFKDRPTFSINSPKNSQKDNKSDNSPPGPTPKYPSSPSSSNKSTSISVSASSKSKPSPEISKEPSPMTFSKTQFLISLAEDPCLEEKIIWWFWILQAVNLKISNKL